MAHDPPGTTNIINKSRIDTEFLRNKLKLKSLEAKDSLSLKYPHVKKFFEDRGIDLGKIRQHSAKIISAGALAGTLLFSSPLGIGTNPNATEIARNADEPTQAGLLDMINNILPQKVGPLTRSQEKTLEQVFQNTIGVSARASLEGEHLNTTYGYIGAEQNLMRYPGDSVSDMAPGRGAWGYFAPSKSALTPDLIEKEKWYAVVQTLYLPDWDRRLVYLRDWYKYRKVLIVNTVNGNAVVADIADSGPAAWTGKHFGGSPEVMEALGGPRYKKGAVVIFFVDDPEHKVPLGPVDYNRTNLAAVSLKQA
jgi:hypothetical protein